MYIIGITGGVGCGKSEVLSYLRDRWEFRVMELDRIGHTLLLPGSPALTESVSSSDLLFFVRTGRLTAGQSLHWSSGMRHCSEN